MRAVQKRLPVGAPVRLVSLTADPEYDSPEVLNRYGKRYGYEPTSWLFLTGPKKAVYDLAADGLYFSVVDKEETQRSSVEDRFIHSTAFALVDSRGHLRGVVQGEATNAVDQILERVKWLLQEPQKP
jgi:protein SCO1/2